jgi:hypothetical protein
VETLTRKGLLVSGGLIAAGAATAGVVAAFFRGDAPRFANVLTAVRRRSPVPAGDPADDAWEAARPILVALAPQRLAPPFAAQAGVRPVLEVAALHDGGELALRIAWADDEADDTNGIDRFGDAVAVQLASGSGQVPPITMGGPGSPVHVLHWRGVWQRDLEARTGVETLYPHLVRDESPDDVLPAETAALWYPARAVGNAIAAVERPGPVEELVAEGFGTLTPLAEQRARGGARWADGVWAVTIGIPLERTPAGEPLAPGSAWPISFALWRGSRGEHGSRKHFGDWATLELEA